MNRRQLASLCVCVLLLTLAAAACSDGEDDAQGGMITPAAAATDVTPEGASQGSQPPEQLTLEEYFVRLDKVAREDKSREATDTEFCATQAQLVPEIGLIPPLKTCLNEWKAGVANTKNELDGLGPPSEAENPHSELLDTYDKVANTIEEQLGTIDTVQGFEEFRDWGVEVTGAFWNATIVQESLCPALQEIALVNEVDFDCEFRPWPIFFPGFLEEQPSGTPNPP